MNKIFSLLLIILFTISSADLHAQYKLKKAFPNLPSFSYPVEITNAKDSSNRLFVVEQNGLIYTFNNTPNVSSRKIFLDIKNKVYFTGVTGLFGLAFHPDYKHNRYFYVHYVFDSVGSPINNWIRISRFQTSAENPDTVLRQTEVSLITIPLQRNEHNGGKVAFGPDGYLYVSAGDASVGGDSSRNLSSLLGKMIRINVDVPSERLNYSIPQTNPFFKNTEGYREEIFAYGLRNPWKFSFDFQTNRIYLGDVGSTRYEEVDIIENGSDYGWNKMEGFHCYPYFAPCDTTGYGFARPIWEYSLFPFGQAVVGGYVYRGTLHPDLVGKYIYGDYIDAKMWAMTYNGTNVTSNTLLFDTSYYLVTFGVDENNEVFASSYTEGTGIGNIMRLYNSSVITLNLKVIIEGLYNPTADRLNIRDTVSVYLYRTNDINVIRDSAVIVIDSVNFNGLCFFKNAPSGTYYIKVKHRNSIDTWSKAGGIALIRGEVSEYDFTSDSSDSFGNNLKLKGSRYCVISGDCNSDGVINAVDRANLIGKLGNSGYVVTDLDGNRIVNAIDRAILISNLGKSKMEPPSVFKIMP